MKDQKNNPAVTRIFKDFVVPQRTLVLISTILFVSDFFLSKPLYIMVLDVGELLGALLALGMATLFAVLPKVAAKLLVRQQYGLSAIAILCGLGLISFIYLGQMEVAHQKANDPLAGLLGTEVQEASSFHLVATALVALLYVCATFLSFLYFADYKGFKPKQDRAYANWLSRLFQWQAHLLQGQYDRALLKPTLLAEQRVDAHIQTLEEKEAKLSSTLHKLKANYRFDQQSFENAQKRLEAAIWAAYHSE